MTSAKSFLKSFGRRKTQAQKNNKKEIDTKIYLKIK